jgi:hypothetical protein
MRVKMEAFAKNQMYSLRHRTRCRTKGADSGDEDRSAQAYAVNPKADYVAPDLCKSVTAGGPRRRNPVVFK